jgi:hypothetical protein
MAKNSGDVILRDRLQFQFAAGGNRTTLYGRINLDDYVSAVDRKGLSIKEVYFQPRAPASEVTALNTPNTGEMALQLDNTAGVGAEGACLKIFATGRAYQNASEVGIASPDVYALETWKWSAQETAQGLSQIYEHMRWGPSDLHMEGLPLISDMLIGVAADRVDNYANQNVEIDVIVVAQPITVSQKEITQLLTQGQDL